MNIAICDDDPKELKIIVEMLEEYRKSRGNIDLHYCTFSSGNKLLWSEKSASFDLYVLDILMPKINGIEMGLGLRKQGAEGEIIYLTTSQDYAVDSYQTRAFYYLLKPIMREKFFLVLDMVFEKLSQKQSKFFIIKTNEGVSRVNQNNILYIERANRIMRCYLLNGDIITSISLRTSFKEAVLPLLEDECFVLCGASYVLNLRHVSAIENNMAIIDNGNQVPIPRRLNIKIKQAWMDYWLDGGSI